jgi:hypothetical protein
MMKMNLMKDQRTYNSVTYKVNSPAAPLYIHILEDELGNPKMIQINAGKCGSEVSACCNALSLLASRLLELHNGFDMLLEDFSSITTDKLVRNSGGLVCRSIPEGIFVALMRYRNEKNLMLIREFPGRRAYLNNGH